MNHNVVEFLKVIDVPIGIHGLILSEIVFDEVQLQVTKRDDDHVKVNTYIVLSFDRNTLPDNDGVTEFA